MRAEAGRAAPPPGDVITLTGSSRGPRGEYPPLEDYAVIANGLTSALVGFDGSVDWLCLPRVDHGSCFGRILDWARGGYCHIAPPGTRAARREYIDSSLVLATTFETAEGEAVVLDALPWADEAGQPVGLLRVVDCKRGQVELDVRIEPRFDYGMVRPWLRQVGERCYTAIGGDDALVISGDFSLELDDHGLAARVVVRRGDRLRLYVEYLPPELADPHPPERPSGDDLDRMLATTIARWARWARRADAPGGVDADVLRSAALLVGLSNPRTGAVAAAATASLPEAIGSERNWDYRYSWVRDSTFAVRSLAQIGFAEEADRFRRFIARSAAGHADELQIVFGVGGERRLAEWTLDALEGYRGSRPVRVGNDAVTQVQRDAIGELVALTWHWHLRGHSPDDDDWRFLCAVIESAVARWREPDAGIWEWRGEPLHFVHSKAMCWSAIDRGLRLARECGLPAPAERWAAARDELRETIDREGFDETRATFVQAFGHRELDAAALLLPAADYVAWDDPRMIGTVDAIRDELAAGDGLLYRYRREDGLGGHEGAFLACSFWLAECLARQGRADEAREVFDATVATSSDLGIYSEQYDPDARLMLGNIPQALTHLAHIGAALALAEPERGVSRNVPSPWRAR